MSSAAPTTGSERKTRKRAYRSRIVIVGEEARVAPVSKALRGLAVRRETTPWRADIPENLDDTAVALVVVGPIPRVPLRLAVGLLREATAPRDLAIIAVVPNEMGDGRVRGIYDRGATAVFFWPREAPVLPRCLVQMVATVMVWGRASKLDRALARTVRAHLKVVPGLGSQVRARVVHGVAFLSGQTNFLWKKRLAEDAAAGVAGIQGVVTRDLRVTRSDISDRTLAGRVRRVLRDTSQVDESTLAVRVAQGHVTLAGSVASRHDLSRAVDLLANLRGVRSVDRLAVVSSAQHRRDRSAAKGLRQLLGSRVPDDEVKLAYFGSVAELSGRVERLQRKKEIERIVTNHDAVDRVINKIEVAR